MGIIIHLMKLNIYARGFRWSNDKSESEIATKGLDESNWNG